MSDDFQQQGEPDVGAPDYRDLAYEQEPYYEGDVGPYGEPVDVEGLTALVQEHPELGDEQMAIAALENAQALANALGRPELAAHPEMIRAAHFATQGFGQQQQAQQERDIVDEIIHPGGGLGRDALPFH